MVYVYHIEFNKDDIKDLRFETEPENEILTEIKHNIYNYATRAQAYIENLSCRY